MKDKLYLKRLDVKITGVETVKEWAVCGHDVYIQIGELYRINRFVDKAGLQYVNLHPIVSNPDIEFPIHAFIDAQCDTNVYVEVTEKYATHVWTYNKDEGETLSVVEKKTPNKKVYLEKVNYAKWTFSTHVWFNNALWKIKNKLYWDNVRVQNIEDGTIIDVYLEVAECFTEVSIGEATHTYSKEYGLTELVEVVKNDTVGELGMIKIIVDRNSYVLFPQSAVKKVEKVGVVINVDIQYHEGTIASEQFICDPDYGIIEFI